MADIKWCEIPEGSDCITDWANMVEYIKHSALTDFIIHEVEGTCTDTGQAFKFSSSGIESLMYGGADAGDDLIFLANTADDCSSISLFGDAGITVKISDSSIFEVATCSDETLFEVDSDPADKHVDFHCLDAHNFCLENRTDDPAGPTCTGQMWFRSDLV